MKQKTKYVHSVRCVECVHAGPMKDLVIHCDVSDLGRVGNAKRYCRSFMPKEKNEQD